MLLYTLLFTGCADSSQKINKTSESGTFNVELKYQDEIKEVCGDEVLTNHLIINSVVALNNNKNKLGRTILKQIPNKIFKKFILQLFSYLRIKPIYFTRIIIFFSRKR